MGEMADLFLDGLIEDDGTFWGPSGPSIPRCKYCGKPDLFWERTSSGWRLHEKDKRIHFCPEYFAFKKRKEEMKDEITISRDEALKALQCLYIAVDQSVADDVNNKVKNYISLLENKLSEKDL